MSGGGEILLTAKGLAALTNISERTIWRWSASGRMPPPIRLGRKVLWRRQDIDAWVAAGCPAERGTP